MPFDRVDPQVDFPSQERAVLELWNRLGVFDLLQRKNLGKPKWSFLDGPITANNPMGVHHAWGRTYKDLYQRYYAMTGHQLRYQNGFDCQGLWVEVEVEKQLRDDGVVMRSKRDIENLVPGDPFASIDHFVQLCKARVDRFAKIQTSQSIRLGYWMDWDREEDWQKPPDQRRSYYTMSEENNYSIWAFLKQCHERGFVYRGYDAMPWCPRCGSGLSQMEVAEGYQRVAHRAVFVRFPLRDRPGENLLAWTTTPWTLSSNVAAAVNPKLTYIKVLHRDQVFYLAKGALTAKRLEEEFQRKEWVEGVPKLKSLEQIFREKGGFEIQGELLGSDMIGWTYDGPFDDLPAAAEPGGFPHEVAEVAIQKGWAEARSARDMHRVIAWDMVGESEGTGIVHIAPGCGKEDFQLGKEQRLPPISPLGEDGVFLPGTGGFEGKAAVDPATADWVFEQLRSRQLLFATEQYPHSYPHCWRCKTELLFRLVDEWFISMTWRDDIVKSCRGANWIPEFSLQRELDWLKNMGDWMISKKRFWGLALPVWVCQDCKAFDVIGGPDELEKRAVSGWDTFKGHTPHRPWIDQVKISCSKCGGVSSRVADVGNPWLDAGIVPFSTMGWRQNPEEWKTWFPADFVVESFPGQFRNWFYSLLAMSTMLSDRAPFKTLLGHALVRDQWGRAMHKSDGNSIPFEGVADHGYDLKMPDGTVQSQPAMGADLVRWMFSRQNPANNINFGTGPAEEVRSKLMMKIWNTYSFFSNYANLDAFDPAMPQVPVDQRPDLDRWILSGLQLLIRSARDAFDRFDVASFCLECERFVEDHLSNWYIRRNRRRFWKSETSQDKLAAYQTLYSVLVTLSKITAPIMPFLSEAMYQNLVLRGAPASENQPSVHLTDFPESQEDLIDADLVSDMEHLLRLVSIGASARSGAKIKIRQPLAELRVSTSNEGARRAVSRFSDQICEELNIKKVSLHDPSAGRLLRREIKPNFKSLGPKVGARLKEVQAALAIFDPANLVEGQAVPIALLDGTVISLEPADYAMQTAPPQGWSGIAAGSDEVLLDIQISKELAAEGMAREVVRHIQDLRKRAGLKIEDRIELFLRSESAALVKILSEQSDYITSETLSVQWSFDASSAAVELSGPQTDFHHAIVKAESQSLEIYLRKIAIPLEQSKAYAT